MGSAGFCPIALPCVIKELSPIKNPIVRRRKTLKLLDAITDHTYKVWKTRNKIHNTHTKKDNKKIKQTVKNIETTGILPTVPPVQYIIPADFHKDTSSVQSPASNVSSPANFNFSQARVFTVTRHVSLTHTSSTQVPFNLTVNNQTHAANVEDPNIPP